MARHQYGISVLVPQTSFRRKPVIASPNVGCFLTRSAVVSPEGVRQDLSRFARCHATLYNMANLLLLDVILVNLGFHMCSDCLSMLIPFSQA